MYYLKYLCTALAAQGLSCGPQDLWSWLWHVGSSSLTRDWTQTPCTGSAESGTRPSGKSHNSLLKSTINWFLNCIQKVQPLSLPNSRIFLFCILKKPYLVIVTSNILCTHLLATANLPSKDLLILNISYRWNGTIHDSLSLASFTWPVFLAVPLL